MTWIVLFFSAISFFVFVVKHTPFTCLTPLKHSIRNEFARVTDQGAPTLLGLALLANGEPCTNFVLIKYQVCFALAILRCPISVGRLVTIHLRVDRIELMVTLFAIVYRLTCHFITGEAIFILISN